MKIVIELVVAWVMNDQHAALLQQGLIAIKVEVITQAHYLHQQRIQDRINVIGRNIGNAADQYVALTAHRDGVLLKSLLDYFFMHRLGLARKASRHLVLRRHRVEQLAARGPRQLAHRVAHGFKLHAIESREVVFVLGQKIHVAFVHAVVDVRFDVKDVQMLVNDLAEPPALVAQFRTRGIHIAV